MIDMHDPIFEYCENGKFWNELEYRYATGRSSMFY